MQSKMKKLIGVIGLGLMCMFAVVMVEDMTVDAATSGLYTYKVSNGEATITDYQYNSASGDIQIPDTLGGYPVTSIGSGAFDYCNNLISIEIPKGVTSIGQSAFWGCRSLTSIEIPNGVANIEPYTFYDCSSLASIKMQDGVTSIGNAAFNGCSSLTRIEIPASVTSIGQSAFNGCSSLTRIEIPASVTSIGQSAFDGCSSLSSIKIPDGVTSIGQSAFNGCSSLSSIKIPDGVTSIEQYTFWECNSLTSIEIPNGVTSIGRSAFNGCSSLTSVEIPNGVANIEPNVFYDCSSLTSIKIPDSVTSIGDDAFYGCSSLMSIHIKDIETWLQISFETSDAYPSNYALYVNNQKVTECIIPEGVTSINDYAFYGCVGLTSIEMPEGVTSIGQSAFDGCSSLSNIKIPDGVTSIESWAFYGCSSLTSIEIPDSVTSIGQYSLRGCNSLTSITIPFVDGLFGYIFGAEKYYNNNNDVPRTLKRVVITKATSISDYAFYDCDSLASIEIPNTVEIIGSHAFYGCSDLISIRLPDHLQDIAPYMFYDCTELASVGIPKSVKSIDEYAFSGCWELEDVWYQGTAEQRNRISIDKDGNAWLTNAMWHLDSYAGFLVEDFVTRLYNVCLNREPDMNGKKNWIDTLLSGRVTGIQAAKGFVFSQEFKNKNYCNEDYVKQLYRAFMGREADAGGLAGWVKNLNNGMTREAVFNGFALSREFRNICTEYEIKVGGAITVPKYGTIPTGTCTACGVEDGVTQFVKRLYRICLDREADAGGLASWSKQLWNHTSSGRKVAQGFIFSQEFKNKNYSNEVFVEYLYEAFMGRASDAAGKAGWVKNLERGMTRKQVFDGFAGSKEFTNICNQYGILRD